MHAYSDPPPRAVARTATVLHHLRNRSGARVSLTAEEWAPPHEPSRFAFDLVRADVEPGAACCFAARFGSDLTLTLDWGNGAAAADVYQLRLPWNGGLPVWTPSGKGVVHGGLQELRGPAGTQPLPQWLLASDIFGQQGADALEGVVARDIPEALRNAGCFKQAELWESAPPAGCEAGPCTVFAVRALDDVLSPAAVSVPDAALFLDSGTDLGGSEKTADGGLLRYGASPTGLRVLLSGPDRRPRLEAELQASARLPVRTRERHRIVYALPEVRPAENHVGGF